jgi:hypothetical protein
MKSLKHETLPDGRSSKLKNLVEEDLNGSRHIQRGYAPEGAKRRYEAHFINKLTDCDGENSETDSSLDFARDCNFITEQEHDELTSICEEVGKMLGGMIQKPRPFLTSEI